MSELGVTLPVAADPSCIPSASPFAVVGASWGLPGSSVSAGPGELDVPLTITFLYTGGCALSSASFEAFLTSPFSALGGASISTTYEVNVGTSASLSETYYVNVSPDATLGGYSIPVAIGYNTSDIQGVYSQSVYAQVYLEGVVSLSFSAGSDILYSGVVNNVTITLANSGSGAATSVSESVAGSGQVSILNAPGSTASILPGGSVAYSLHVFVPGSLSGSAVSLSLGAKYYDPTSASLTYSQTLGFYVEPYEPRAPFVLEGAQWGSSSLSPQPGDSDVPLVLTVQYVGTAPAEAVESSLKLPTGFTSVGGTHSAVQYTASVQPDQEVQLTFTVDIAKTVVPGLYNFSLSLDWESGVSSSFSQVLHAVPPEVGSVETATGVSLALSQVNETAVAGKDAELAFVLANNGASSAYSVSLSLNAPSPLAVVSGSPSAFLAVLEPGENKTYTMLVGSSPGATGGIYGGTMVVTYSDISGESHTQSFSVGFTLTGSVVFVVQDETVSQTSTSLTVSGSLLDEGGASAYYLAVTGTASGGSGNATSDYVGEVDPNSPTPFTITIPYIAPSSPTTASVDIQVSYKDSFGNVWHYTTASEQRLESREELAGSSVVTTGSSSGGSQKTVTIVFFGVIGAIAVAAVVGAVVVRRRRAALNPEPSGKVI